MEQKNYGSMVKNVFLGFGISVLMTVVLALAAALILYIGGAGKGALNVSVIVIYIVSILAGGWTAGHRIRHRKFIWGTIVGCLYLMAVFGLGIVNGGNTANGTEIHISIAAAVTCLGSGMLGGMLG